MANEFMNKRVAKVTYDFSVDGGAVSAITPASNEIIPSGAVITQCYSNPLTTITSGGSATIALAVGGVTLKAATAYNNAAFTAITAHSPTLGSTTSSAAVTVTVATAALTAGKLDIFVEYLV